MDLTAFYKNSSTNGIRVQRITNLLIITVLGCYILYAGRTLFIPLSMGLFVAFILYPLCKWFEKKGMNKTVAITLVLTLFLLLFSLVIWLLVKQILGFTDTWPLLREKLNTTFYNFGNYLEANWNISPAVQLEWRKQFFENSSSFIVGMIRVVIARSAVSLVMIFLVPVYAFLLLLYRQRLVLFLKNLLPHSIGKDIAPVLHSTIHTYFKFINGMLVVYLIVGVLNSAGLLLLGIPHAILFGFIASVLTFIPYVGIITASLLPITIAWITYNSVYYPLAIAGIFAFVQYLEANIIFPWAVGNRLNLNTLTVIIAVVAGGILWGGAGMVLFIPFAAIAKLLAEKIPGGETIVYLLGNEVLPVTQPPPSA
jgi:predicted PurR-regulated permease PerM